MKTTIIIILSIAIGWMLRSSLVEAEAGRDWKPCIGWALLGVADLAGTFALTHWGLIT